MRGRKRRAARMKALHVVAGVLADAHSRVLVTERPAGKHLAGTWEFPGGKREDGEDAVAALRRELEEELGVRIDGAEPLIRVPWRYSTHAVDLEVYRVGTWHGVPHGREGQGMRWLDAAALRAVAMPSADRPVVVALQLPRAMAVTPADGTRAALLAHVERALDAGARLVQFRRPDLAVGDALDWARAVRALTRRRDAALLVNGDAALADAVGADGLHVSAARARALAARPVPPTLWFGVSCHDRAELAHALALGADYVVVGAVRATATHAGGATLGWTGFAGLVHDFPLPAFAIGGVAPRDLAVARAHGAFGVAGITAF
jgi:8-oxo-dGTP diphosphatase